MITAQRLLRGCRRAARRSIAGDGWCRSVSARWWCDRPSCPISGERAGDWKSARGPAKSIVFSPIGCRRDGPCPIQRTRSAGLEHRLDHRALGNAGAREKAVRVRLRRNRHRRRADRSSQYPRDEGGRGTAIELPKFRDAGGVWRAAITLPEEVHSPIAKAVFDELVERGLAVRRLGAMTAVSPSPG
jgi:hypothetical protein